VQVESAGRESVLLKPILTHGEDRPRRFPPNNEQVGMGMSGSQPDVSNLSHPRATYVSPKVFLLLACLRRTW
jgi:hypothetical protein